MLHINKKYSENLADSEQADSLWSQRSTPAQHALQEVIVSYYIANVYLLKDEL